MSDSQIINDAADKLEAAERKSGSFFTSKEADKFLRSIMRGTGYSIAGVKLECARRTFARVMREAKHQESAHAKVHPASFRSRCAQCAAEDAN